MRTYWVLMYYYALIAVLVCITMNTVKGKQILEVEKKEGYDLHTLRKLEEIRTNASSSSPSSQLSSPSFATSKAVNQGRSSQFAVCRQSGICLGRVIVCPMYCFSGNAIPTTTTKKYDNEVVNSNNYYYYYYYDDGQPPSAPGSPGGHGGSPGSPGSPGGGFGGGRGGHGGAPGSPGSPGGGFGGGRGGAPGSPGSPGGSFGGGPGGNGGGGGPSGFVPPPGPSGSFRRGKSGSIGAGNGCKYDCLTSCRAFCA